MRKKYNLAERRALMLGYRFEEVVVIDGFTKKEELWSLGDIRFYVRSSMSYFKKNESPEIESILNKLTNE